MAVRRSVEFDEAGRTVNRRLRRGWELRSRSGAESVRWVVREIDRERGRPTCRCDVLIEGEALDGALSGSETAGPSDTSDKSGYRLEAPGLELSLDGLARLVDQIAALSELPGIERRSARFECAMGSLFDQRVRLSVGQRRDTLSGSLQVATVDFALGRLTGELRFPVEMSALREMAEQVESSLSLARTADEEGEGDGAVRGRPPAPAETRRSAAELDEECDDAGQHDRNRGEEQAE